MLEHMGGRRAMVVRLPSNASHSPYFNHSRVAHHLSSAFPTSIQPHIGQPGVKNINSGDMRRMYISAGFSTFAEVMRPWLERRLRLQMTSFSETVTHSIPFWETLGQVERDGWHERARMEGKQDHFIYVKGENGRTTAAPPPPQPAAPPPQSSRRKQHEPPPLLPSIDDDSDPDELPGPIFDENEMIDGGGGGGGRAAPTLSTTSIASTTTNATTNTTATKRSHHNLQQQHQHHPREPNNKHSHHHHHQHHQTTQKSTVVGKHARKKALSHHEHRSRHSSAPAKAPADPTAPKIPGHRKAHTVKNLRERGPNGEKLPNEKLVRRKGTMAHWLRPRDAIHNTTIEPIDVCEGFEILEESCAAAAAAAWTASSDARGDAN